jgi:prepilin-type processing-associated H-X9-DG protein
MGLGFTYTNSTDPNRRTWALSVVAYLEQNTLYNATNFIVSFYMAQNTTVMNAKVASFHCPTDPNTNTFQTGNTSTQRYEGNYVVNWGNTHYGQDQNPNRDRPGASWPNPFTGPLGTVMFVGAPFTGNDSKSISYFTDGTSNTLLMAEVIIAQDVNGTTGIDTRGDIYNDDVPCTMFMAYTPPNSTIPDYIYNYCNYPFQNNPPCLKNTTVGSFTASRSFHPGGVNALLGDGSVRFFKNSISVNTWRALSTPNGGEVLDASSY